MTTFQDTVDGACGGDERWQLRCVALDGTHDSIVPWPPAGGDWKEHVTTFLPPGAKYRIEADRVNADDVTPSAIKSALQRLAKYGPTSTILDLTRTGPAAPGATFTASATRTPPATPPRRAASPVLDMEDSELRALERDRMVAELETAKMGAELQRRRVQRELQSQTNAGATGGEFAAMIEAMRSGFDSLRNELRPRDQTGALIATLAPVLGQVLQTIIDGSQKRDALMLQVLTGGASSSTSSTAQMLELLQVAKELVGDGGGSDGSMLGDVLAALRAIPAAAQQPSPQAATVPAITPQPKPRPNPNDPKMRTLLFLQAVQSYAADGADPVAAADDLEQRFLLLPADFRRLILTNSVDSIVGDLRRFMPAPLHDRFTAAVASSAEIKQWLADFIAALRDDGSDDDDSDDAGDDYAPAFADFDRSDLDPRHGVPQPITQAPPINLFGNGSASDAAEDAE